MRVKILRHSAAPPGNTVIALEFFSSRALLLTLFFLADDSGFSPPTDSGSSAPRLFARPLSIGTGRAGDNGSKSSSWLSAANDPLVNSSSVRAEAPHSFWPFPHR